MQKFLIGGLLVLGQAVLGAQGGLTAWGQDFFSDSSSNSSPNFSSDLAAQDFLNKKSAQAKSLVQGVSFQEQYQNRAMGEWALQHLTPELPLLDDFWVREVLSELTWQLNAQARQQAPLAVLVIDDPNINAFAIMGGVIGINTGTILAARNLDEVASVLAHEVAHLSQHHHERGANEQTKALLMQIGGLLATALASRVDGDVAAAVMMGSQTMALNNQMAFSRENEREADRIGMQILAKAGFDPKAMPRFFATLQQKSQLNQSKQGYLPSFVMTHPLSSERLSEAENRANQYPKSTTNPQTQTSRQALFDLLYWQIAERTNQVSENRLQNAAKHSQGAKLALIKWYGKQGKYQKAQALIDQIKQQKNRSDLDPLFTLIQAQIAQQQNNYTQAQQLIENQLALYPERQDLQHALAQLLLNNPKNSQNTPSTQQRLHQALKYLQALSKTQAYDPKIWQNLQITNEQLAKYHPKTKIYTINALRYRAQNQLWQAQYDPALTSLALAKQQADPKNRSLIATLNREIDNVQRAKNYHP